jgi:ribosomal protein S12 methylthiotransferase
MSGAIDTLKKVSFVSLGCPKNLVDSEVILGRLAQAGWALCERTEDSDIVIINTCGFLGEARAESVRVVDQAIRLRDEGRIRGVVVAGCLPQRDPREALEALGRADAILGSDSREHIVPTCDALLEGAPLPKLRVTADLPRFEVDRDRLRLTPRHFAYLRLSEGCSHTCAFCVIPKIKGRFRSKPREVVLSEARELAADGARELILIAQDTTSWGLDLYKRLALPELLEELSGVEGIEWIRLLYCYPSYVTPRLIGAVASLPKLVHYMDLPIQHTVERMLRRMRRGVTERSQQDLIRSLREAMPDLVLRTTLIVGFPGETDEEFERLCEDVRRLAFERLGVFCYSDEPGTRAFPMDGRVPEPVKEERFDRIMRIQQEVARAVNRRFVGRTVPVILDRARGEGIWEGRTYGDAPDVDGVVRLRGAGGSVGQIARARIQRVRGYDLEGSLA